MTAVALLSIVAASACKDSKFVPLGNAETILAEIKVAGAPRIARRIETDESFARAVIDGISTGDSVWLKVAAELTPASAAAEASLSIALASALPHSPDDVLAMLGPKYPVEEVCGIPFLKADSARVTTYHAEATAALQGVRTALLLPKRDSCRIALDDARDRRLERINPSYIIKNKPAAPARRATRRPVKKPPTVAAPVTPPVTPPDTSSSD
ncbi:MAG: hypothetical protein ABJB95_04875 [Gemmatimonadales bacterium]